MKQKAIAQRRARPSRPGSHYRSNLQRQAIGSAPENETANEVEDASEPGEFLLSHDFSRVAIQPQDRLGTALDLTGSVGKNGQNRAEDVIKVQARLSLLGFDAGVLSSGEAGSAESDAGETGTDETGTSERQGQYRSQMTAAILEFQQFFLDEPNGLIEENSPSHLRLNQLQGAAEARMPQPKPEEPTAKAEAAAETPKFRVKRGRDFAQSLDGKAIDSKLMQTLTNFFNYLIAHDQVGGDITLAEGMRDPRKAHRWSTAYAIRNDQIPLETLQKLSNGRDIDGNQWYEKGDTIAQAKRRAADLGLNSPSTPASEGYPLGEAKQVPNHWDKGISNHLLGKAVKAFIPWTTEKAGQLNDAVANDLIKKFGLKRPVSKDETHFELLQGSPQGDEEYAHRDSET